MRADLRRCRPATLAACAAWLAALACGAAPERADEAPGAGPTAAERQRVLAFWRHYNGATQRRVAGDPAAARAGYDSALVLDPRHADALYYVGNAAFELGDFAAAEVAWRRLLAVDPAGARAHVQLGVLYSCDAAGATFDLARARQELEAALALNSAETGVLVRLGEVLLVQGDLAGAAGRLEAARRTHPGSVGAHYLCGYLAWRDGARGAALDDLRQAVAAAGGGRADPSASSEGQTRRGAQPLLESGRAGLLAPHHQRLQDWPGQVTAPAAQAEYEALHRALEALRAQHRRQRPPALERSDAHGQ